LLFALGHAAVLAYPKSLANYERLSNDREEWSENAFEIIREILVKRGADIPEQNEFIPDKKDENDTPRNVEEFTEMELKIIDDENPPAFYDPFEVLKISNWMELSAKVMVGFVILYNLVTYSSTNALIKVWFSVNPNPFLETAITLLLVALNTAIGAGISYFALITLSRVLKILMEMEFNSRITK
jgi:hypothetical protein